MASAKGQKFGFYIEDDTQTLVKVGATTSKEISFSRDTLDTISDDNADWRTALAGIRSAELTIEGLYDYSGDAGTDLVETAFRDDASRKVALQGETSGDVAYTFAAYVTGFSITAETDAVITFSVDIESDGEVTKGTVV